MLYMKTSGSREMRPLDVSWTIDALAEGLDVLNHRPPRDQRAADCLGQLTA